MGPAFFISPFSMTFILFISLIEVIEGLPNIAPSVGIKTEP
ncbi:MAG: hypothetical protein ACR5KV_07775 [Wolbachia sp.]